MASREEGLSCLTTGDQLPDNIKELVRTSFSPEDSGTTPKYVREWCCLWFHKYHSAGKFDMCKEIMKYAIAEGNGAVHESYDTSVPMQEFTKIHVDMVLEQLKLVNKKMTMLIALILPENPSTRDNIARHYNAVDLQMIQEALIANYEKKLGQSNQTPTVPDVPAPKAGPVASGGGGGKKGDGAIKPSSAAKAAQASKALPKGDKADKAAALSSKGKEGAAVSGEQDLDTVLPLIAGFIKQPDPVLKKRFCDIMKSVVDGTVKIDIAQMTRVFDGYMNARRDACLPEGRVSSMRYDNMQVIYKEIEKIQANDFGDFHDALTGILFAEKPSAFPDVGQFPPAIVRAREVLDKIIVKQAIAPIPAQADGGGAAGTAVRDQTGGKPMNSWQLRQIAPHELWGKVKEIKELDTQKHLDTIHTFLFDGLINATSCREVQILWAAFVMFCKRSEQSFTILDVNKFLGRVLEVYSGLRGFAAKVDRHEKRMSRAAIKGVLELWDKVKIPEVLRCPKFLPTLFAEVDVNLGKVYVEDSGNLRRFLYDHLQVHIMTHWIHFAQSGKRVGGAGGSKDQMASEKRVPAAAKPSPKRRMPTPPEDQGDVGTAKKSKPSAPADSSIVDPSPPPGKPASPHVVRKVLASKVGKEGANDAKEAAAPSLDHAKRAVSRIMEQKSKISPAPKAAAPAAPAGKTAAPAAPAPPAGKVASPAAPASRAGKVDSPAAPAAPARKVASPAAPAPPASPAAPAPPAPAPAKRDFRAAFAETQQFLRTLCRQRGEEPGPKPTPEVDEQD